MHEIDYYKQPQIWNDFQDEYQRHVAADILSLLPPDCTSILDVGCGDGWITNCLPANMRVVGLDISAEAMRKVQRETFVASATDMPFPDKSFDLVMINDVLEHLEDADRDQVIRELCRVASRWVLITVPLLEQLAEKQTRCRQCDAVFHIHHHRKTWDEARLLSLVSLPWRPADVRYSGGALVAKPDPTVALRNQVGQFKRWNNAICAVCGTADLEDGSDKEFLSRVFDSLAAETWWKERAPRASTCDRSEIMVLFSLDPVREDRTQPATPLSKRSPSEADFTNKLQAVKDWTEGANWARFRLCGGAAQGPDGIRNQPENGRGWIEVRLPATMAIGDTLIIEATGTEACEKIQIIGIDGITHRTVTVGEAIAGKQRAQIEIQVHAIWQPDRTGLEMQVILPDNVTLHALRVAGNEPALPMMNVAAGHLVLSQPQGPYARSWGFDFSDAGWWPYPDWLMATTEPPVLTVQPSGWPDLRRKLNDVESNIAGEVGRWREALDKVDAARNAVENAYAQLGREDAILKNEAAELGKEVTELRSLIQATKKENQALEQSFSRGKQKLERDLRVLVISHMFPHADQPGSGSFILEQAQALAEHEGVNVRVISCRPFWCNSRKPQIIRRALKLYAKQSKTTDWVKNNGVTVAYPPYLVGGIFKPQIHGWSYEDAVRRFADRAWKTFKFDIIHAHTAYLDGNAGRALAKRFGVPLLITEHTGPFTSLTNRPVIRQVTLNALKKADRVLCVSDALRNEVQTYFPAAMASHFGTIHNGVDTDIFHTPQTWAPDVARPKLLFVGGLDEWKNPLLLLDAFALVRQSVPGATLTLVGEGPQLGQVTARAGMADLLNSVKITGRLSRADVAHLMREQCDILVVPSKGETFGCVLIEAMASGKPVVATNVGGPNDIVTAPWQGLLCEMKEPGVLAAAILQTVQKLPTFSANKIRDYAREKFDFRIVAKNLVNEYAEMLKLHRNLV